MHRGGNLNEELRIKNEELRIKNEELSASPIKKQGSAAEGKANVELSRSARFRILN